MDPEKQVIPFLKRYYGRRDGSNVAVVKSHGNISSALELVNKISVYCWSRIDLIENSDKKAMSAGMTLIVEEVGESIPPVILEVVENNVGGLASTKINARK